MVKACKHNLYLYLIAFGNKHIGTVLILFHGCSPYFKRQKPIRSYVELKIPRHRLPTNVLFYNPLSISISWGPRIHPKNSITPACVSKQRLWWCAARQKLWYYSSGEHAINLARLWNAPHRNQRARNPLFSTKRRKCVLLRPLCAFLSRARHPNLFCLSFWQYCRNTRAWFWVWRPNITIWK